MSPHPAGRFGREKVGVQTWRPSIRDEVYFIHAKTLLCFFKGSANRQ